jgi:hypothetical protein
VLPAAADLAATGPEVDRHRVVAALGEEVVDLALEVLEVVEALVDAREADVGDLVELAELVLGERPTSDESTSVEPCERSSASISSAARSAASSATGRRVSALRRPDASFSRSNSWRLPSRFTTTSRAASIRS